MVDKQKMADRIFEAIKLEHCTYSDSDDVIEVIQVLAVVQGQLIGNLTRTAPRKAVNKILKMESKITKDVCKEYLKRFKGMSHEEAVKFHQEAAMKNQPKPNRMN